MEVVVFYIFSVVILALATSPMWWEVLEKRTKRKLYEKQMEEFKKRYPNF